MSARLDDPLRFLFGSHSNWPPSQRLDKKTTPCHRKGILNEFGISKEFSRMSFLLATWLFIILRATRQMRGKQRCLESQSRLGTLQNEGPFGNLGCEVLWQWWMLRSRDALHLPKKIKSLFGMVLTTHQDHDLPIIHQPGLLLLQGQ